MSYVTKMNIGLQFVFATNILAYGKIVFFESWCYFKHSCLIQGTFLEVLVVSWSSVFIYWHQCLFVTQKVFLIFIVFFSKLNFVINQFLIFLTSSFIICNIW